MKKTPRLWYVLMRKAFIASGGLTNDFVNFVLKKMRPFQLPKTPVNGVLGRIDRGSLSDIIGEIEKKGFYVFESTLPEATIESIVNYSTSLKCEATGLEGQYTPNEIPGRPRYHFFPNDLLGSSEISNLVTDETLYIVAGAYLGANPIWDMVAMWWSYPSREHRSEAAQLFHFDMDRFKFIKFFFYLTDVTEETGPHCYIQSSHRRLPWRFRKEGRFADGVLEKYYGEEKIKYFTGRKGTIIAVDTRGFHKGVPLVRDNRLILQVEFANSLFGMWYPPLDPQKINPQAKARFLEKPETYLQIFSSEPLT
ncbi:MAG: hypothetical protein AB7H97_15625 [Pseudobdellovibrionaceae bacterium]